MKILLIEDDYAISDALKEGLEDEAFAVDTSYDGDDGFRTASAGNYDLIILDVMLPEINGYEVLRKLRQEENSTPILMLTAKDQEQDIIKGLNKGADDYLAKPFSFDVLLARIHALLRRPSNKNPEILKVEDLHLDPRTKEVTRLKTKIKLTTKEYAILEYLMRNKNMVISKDDFIDHVWDFDADVLPNNVEQFIMLLRRKIDHPFRSNLIQTVPGFGYKIVAPSKENEK